MTPVSLVLFGSMLTLLPLLMIVCTSFLKVSVVLLITRNALGIQQVPGNTVIYSISLAATLFIMWPVFDATNNQIQQVSADKVDLSVITTNYPTIIAPLRSFLLHNINPDTHTRLSNAARQLWAKNGDIPVYRDNMILILSAFVLSELQAGFKIGFLIYIPFLMIDLIVSNILMALGMQMVAPMVISLPLKLLLFILVEGWSRLIEGLFNSYA